ncbi:MAG: LutC/YkgG family protein [Candidatus Flexifilum sp.]|jgi:L-lactate utilization protein LutC
MSSRDRILNRLRSARRPFPDAPPRPARYHQVTVQDDTTPDALLARFTRELTALRGEVFAVDGADAAREQILSLLKQHGASTILSWDFAHIPVPGLREALAEAGIHVLIPDVHDEFRAETLAAAGAAQAGLTGADAALATTGTLVVTSGPGRGRLPTILPPIHIAVIALDQIKVGVESWLARQRADGLPAAHVSANAAFISGPSRTGDIEMELILGVHGPGVVQVVVIR